VKGLLLSGLLLVRKDRKNSIAITAPKKIVRGRPIPSNREGKFRFPFNVETSIRAASEKRINTRAISANTNINSLSAPSGIISNPSGLTSIPIATKIIGAVIIELSIRCDTREYTNRIMEKIMMPTRINDTITTYY